MIRTSADYRRMLEGLLPRGAAWLLRPDSVLSKMLHGIAEEFTRVEERAWTLIEEADPRTTNELLTDWEALLGLPDPCYPVLTSTDQRRGAVVARLINLGGQSPAYFIQLAAAVGYTVTITEFEQARAGIARAGDAITNGDWVHTWRMNIADANVDYARAGTAVAGDPLRVSSAALLECVISKAAPSHTILQFEYGA